MKTINTQNKTDLLKNLFKSNAHYGYTIQLTNVNAFPYVLGTREKNCIINLEHTINNLKRCFLLIQLLFRQNKQILFVCNTNKYKFLQTALFPILGNKNVKLLTTKWLPGYLTKLNNEDIQKMGLMVLLNIDSNQISLKEGYLKSVPIMAFLNTNQNPVKVSYPVMINTINLQSLFFVIYSLRQILIIGI